MLRKILILGLNSQALAPGSNTELDAETLEAVAESAPSVKLSREAVLEKPLAEVMATVKLLESRAAARRLIKVCCFL